MKKPQGTTQQPERQAARERAYSQQVATDGDRTLPLVSIITPAYNRAGYLSETIDSILGQDYPRIEYIVLDDGSTDDTESLLSRYVGRIVAASHPNMGQTQTVNRGFALAHGDILAVVNSDDPLLPGAVSEAVAFLERNPDVLVAYPDWYSIGPHGEKQRLIHVPEHDFERMVRRQCCYIGPGAFFRRQAVEVSGGWDPEFRHLADLDFWLRVGFLGPFARIPQTLATFRVHDDSASVALQGRVLALQQVGIVRKLFSRTDLPVRIRRLRREAFSWAFYYAGVAAGPPRGLAWGYFLRALVTHPPSAFRKWRLLVLLVVPRRLQGAVRSLWWRVQAAFRRLAPLG